MALLCEYFAASSDQDAALTIGWDGGPSRPSDGDQDGNQGYEVLALGGIEPVVLMGQLEARLTNRSLMEILRDPGRGPVANLDGGARLIIPIRERLFEALMSLEESRIPDVAAAWAQAEEFRGQVGPGDLVDALSHLVALTQQAHARSQHVYCWMSV